ncbi:c-type cytochrome [Methylobacillus caricis]|uniref:c-type cytochrome n=1 Tax=Methylobacillus caricis TaxID=1971611 RepID=UPI001CFFA721|nr:c-type cytochrome [Methylobacillus caricis]MCB5188514.1 c-type cytochrome [Methylobacillus caricis]
MHALSKALCACSICLITIQAASAAAPAEALAQKSGCLACHGVEKKMIGPSYKDIAAKYKGDKEAEARLINKVKTGGSGSWGAMPMPPNVHVKDEDIKTLVQWVLSL